MEMKRTDYIFCKYCQELRGPEPDWETLDQASSTDMEADAQISCPAVDKISSR